MPSRTVRISGGQLCWITATILTPFFMYGQFVLIPIALHDSWLAYLLAIALTILVSLLWTGLAARFPSQSLPQTAAALLPGIGWLAGLGYAWYFLYSSAATIRMVSGLFVLYFMPETPLVVFVAMMALLAVSAARHGPEVITRLAIPALMGLVAIFGFFLPAVMARETHPTMLLPILNRGLSPVISGTLAAFGMSADLVVLTSLYAFLNRPGEAGSSTRWGMVVGGAVAFVFMVSGLIMNSPEEMARQTVPGMTLVRSVRVAETLERLESFFVVTWMGPMFVRAALFFWAAVHCLSQGLGLRDYRPLILPLGALLTIFTITIGRDVHTFHAAVQAGAAGALFFGTLIPAALWLTALARGRRPVSGGKQP